MKKFFEVEKITDHIIRLTDISGVSMFLAEGEKEAALIDTGVGIGDLKDEVERFTNKPVKVLLTHGHLDHAFGAAAFEEIYMSLLDAGIVEEHSDMKLRTEYCSPSVKQAGIEITENMLATKQDIDKMKALKDGDVFNLGGMTLEIYALPGHTPGCMTVLFKEARVLLTGDACNPGTFLFFPTCLSVEEYRGNLVEYKKKMKGKYDKIILSHGNEQLDEALFDVVIETCDSVLAGTDDALYDELMGIEAYVAAEMEMTETGIGRRDGKIGNIFYSPNNIYKR